jgi:hypothetical protein
MKFFISIYNFRLLHLIFTRKPLGLVFRKHHKYHNRWSTHTIQLTKEEMGHIMEDWDDDWKIPMPGIEHLKK